MFNNDLVLIIPIIFLVITGIMLMLLDAFKVRSVLPLISIIGFAGAIVLSIPVNDNQRLMKTAFHYMGITDPGMLGLGGMIATDGLASLIIIFLCASGLFTLFFLGDFLKRQDKPIDEVYALLVFCVVGMILLANARDLIITFIGLETMSICLYIMAAMFKRDLKSNEAGLKYFLLGAFSTGFFLYGIALLYGGSGSTNYAMMNMADLADSGLLYPGLALILVGFLFKVSAFPFHAWTPDVYSGTPTPLTGFMATGSKMAAFVAFGVLLNTILDAGVVDREKVFGAIAVLALLTMIYGNFVAIQQTNLKRLLAYSSIAHSGYVMLALCAGQQGLMAAIFYMFIYTLMNIGAFGLIGMYEVRHEDVDENSWKGLGLRNPWFGAALSLFLFSLAGIPPLAGFMGKYILFVTIIKEGLVLFAILGILTSVVGAYYYIRVIVTMFFGKPEEPVAATTWNWAPVTGVAILAALVLLFGVYPSLITGQLDSLYTTAAAGMTSFSQSAP